MIKPNMAQKIGAWERSVLRGAVFASMALTTVWAQAQNAIQSLTGGVQGGVEVIRIETSEPLAAVPTGFTIQAPARIALDFPGVVNNIGRNTIEMILALGGSRWEAAQEAIRQAVRAGMIPTLNQMAVVGIVSLPGMMTGQVLAGESPVDAVRYQIVIMFLIAASSALGTVGAVLLTYRRLFSRNHRFLRDRLQER